jgi:hypothetical protein
MLPAPSLPLPEPLRPFSREVPGLPVEPGEEAVAQRRTIPRTPPWYPRRTPGHFQEKGKDPSPPGLAPRGAEKIPIIPKQTPGPALEIHVASPVAAHTFREERVGAKALRHVIEQGIPFEGKHARPREEPGEFERVLGSDRVVVELAEEADAVRHGDELVPVDPLPFSHRRLAPPDLLLQFPVIEGRQVYGSQGLGLPAHRGKEFPLDPGPQDLQVGEAALEA